MVVKELFTLLGFRVDQSGAKQYEEIFTRLKSMALKIGAAIGLTELAKSIIETTNAWQQQNLQLAYLIGNTEKAHDLMLELNELADRSPFSRNDLGAYAKQLINFGFSVNEITPLMSRLSNIAVVIGKDSIPMIVEAMARMKVRGYADARVMMELFHAGIPIQDELAKKFGVSNFQMNKLIMEGRVGFSDVNDALTRLTTGTGKFAGATATWGNTFEGIWHRIHAILENLVTSIGTNLLPVIETVSEALKNWLDLNKGHIADDFINFLNTVMFAIGFIGGAIWKILKNLGLLPDDKPKTVSSLPGQQVKTGIPIIDQVQAASQPKGPPVLTHQMIEAQKAADKARLDDAARSYQIQNNITVNGAGDPVDALIKKVQQAAEQGTKDGLSKAIRQSAPNFAGATR
jgi:tape measure domain-containing protein